MSKANIDLFAKEIIKGYPLITCLKISIALDDLLEHRHENLSILHEVANELDKHTHKSSIAKFVGSATGTYGKTALGVGVASIIGAPFTGFISGLAGGVLVAAGGTAAILGSATSIGTYTVEYMLCKKAQRLTNLSQLIKRKLKNTKKFLKSLRHFAHNMIQMIAIYLFRLS